MSRYLFLLALALFFLGVISAQQQSESDLTVNAENDDLQPKIAEWFKKKFAQKKSEDDMRVNPGCTVECASYWKCKVEQIWKGSSTQCDKPTGCECNRFAWQQDDDEGVWENLKEFFKKFKKNKKSKSEEDEGWFDNVNLGCTIECTSYWRCKGDQIWKGPSTQCEKPAGCQCDKFAWQQDDDEGRIAEWFKSVADKFKKRKNPNKGKKTTDEDDEDEFVFLKNRFQKKLPNERKGKKTFSTKFGGLRRHKREKTTDEDEGWFDNINLACTVECTSYWRCKGNQIWDGPSVQCEKPTGCQCDKFAWQQDDDENKLADMWKTFSDKIKTRLSRKKNKSPVSKKSRGLKNQKKVKTSNEDEGWFDKINLACTAECTSYWRCKGQQIWDGPSVQCEKPSGCQCDKFAWQKDDDEGFLSQKLCKLCKYCSKLKSEKLRDKCESKCSKCQPEPEN